MKKKTWFGSIIAVIVGGLATLGIIRHTPTVISTKTTFGTLIMGTGDELQIEAAKNYLPIGSLMREGIYLNTATVTDPSIQKYLDAGFQVNLVCRWNNIVQGDNNPVQFPIGENLDKMMVQTDRAFKQWHIVLACYLDEPTNKKMNKGSMAQYIEGAKRFTIVCRNNGVKSTDGSTHSVGACLNLYFEYLEAGDTIKAMSLKNRVFNDQMKKYVERPTNSNPLYTLRMQEDTLLRAYKDCGFDYVNLHWKEPFNGVGDAQHIVEGGYREIFDYIKRISGLPLVCNELGIENVKGSSSVLEEMLTECTNIYMPYVLVLNKSDDGQQLTDPINGKLTASGSSVNTFILNYLK
jgi:hypothetical protein